MSLSPATSRAAGSNSFFAAELGAADPEIARAIAL